MKRYLKLRFLFVLCMVLSLTLVHPFAVYADLNDLMINSSSNALMTLELDDSDYAVMPMSSIGTVTNTISSNSIPITIRLMDSSGATTNVSVVAYKENGRYRFNYNAPSGQYIVRIQPALYQVSLPAVGSYNVSFDYSSDFSYDINFITLYSAKTINNATTVDGSIELSFVENSGDIYIAPTSINLTNVYVAMFSIAIDQSQYVQNVGGSFAINFTRISAGDYPSTAGTNTSNEDYQSDVSSSLSDLSSSVDSMTEDLSSAAENLEYISTSQNLIIQGIDNVVMHISDQLFAFWNQLYNLIHVPTMAKMDDIISAINNMDLEIEVNLDGLKTTINNMSTAVQNKLQSTTDQITGGYDNSGLESDKSELDGVLNQYEQAEEDLFDDAKGNIDNFEFDTPLDQFTGPLSDVSYFLSGLFDAMGPMNVIITFSLTLTIAMVMIGWYRFKGGR